MKNHSKRIVKNTIFLYFRMLFIMIITLYTSRVILNKLGIVDFGINNVVGGLASMFAFFSSSLANASQRFLNIELGRGNIKGAKNIFNQHLLIYLCFATGIIIFSETIGCWFIHHKLMIPIERLPAALWVYQFTVISLCITFMGVIFNSLIIAHEDMKIYSYIGIFEGIAKLTIAFAISYISCDRLVSYSFLLLLVTFCTQISYMIFCFRTYEECRFCFVWNKKVFKETSSFISWNVGGTFVTAVNDQGINMLLNMFFGPAVNTARGISFQINNAINNFGINFFTSIRPQIVKSYASQDYEYLYQLFFNSSRFSVYLLWLFCLPVMLCIDTILHLWLTEVPEYTNVFTRWILAYSMVNMLNNPIWSLALAVGRLKKYIALGSSVFLCAFPLAYIALKLGYSPVSVFVTLFAVRLVYIFVVLNIIRIYIHFSIEDYFYQVIKPCVIVLTLSGIISYSISLLLSDGIVDTVLICLVTFFSTVTSILLVGISFEERKYVISFLRKKIVR